MGVYTHLIFNSVRADPKLPRLGEFECTLKLLELKFSDLSSREGVNNFFGEIFIISYGHNYDSHIIIVILGSDSSRTYKSI